jgi:hypothetical protein
MRFSVQPLTFFFGDLGLSVALGQKLFEVYRGFRRGSITKRPPSTASATGFPALRPSSSRMAGGNASRVFQQRHDLDLAFFKRIGRRRFCVRYR